LDKITIQALPGTSKKELSVLEKALKKDAKEIIRFARL
jgi:hypothetical protein